MSDPIPNAGSDAESSSLQHTIVQLREALEQSPTENPTSRAELLELLTELQHKLTDQPDDADLHRPLLEQLKDSVWQFEKSHPTLTVIVGRVMDNLSRMGI